MFPSFFKKKITIFLFKQSISRIDLNTRSFRKN